MVDTTRRVRTRSNRVRHAHLHVHALPPVCPFRLSSPKLFRPPRPGSAFVCSSFLTVCLVHVALDPFIGRPDMPQTARMLNAVPGRCGKHITPRAMYAANAHAAVFGHHAARGVAGRHFRNKPNCETMPTQVLCI